MTDKEVIKAMLDRAGIFYDVDDLWGWDDDGKLNCVVAGKGSYAFAILIFDGNDMLKSAEGGSP